MVQLDAREVLRRAIAAEHLLFLQAEKHEQLADRWRNRAELAQRRGDDSLAHQALERSVEQELLAAEYRTQCLAQAEVIRRAKHHVSRPTAPSPSRSAEQQLEHMALEDRLESDLKILKAQLGR